MFITEAFAQAAPAAAPSGGAGIILPFILVFAIMYFLLIRPQNKRMREHREMVAALRRGDTVVTAGGIVGKVTKVVDDTTAVVEIADGVRVQVVKASITEVRAKGEPVADTKAGPKAVPAKTDEDEDGKA